MCSPRIYLGSTIESQKSKKQNKSTQSSQRYRVSRHINWATFGETAKSRFHKKASNTSTDSAEYMNNARTGKIRVTFFYKPTIFMPTPMRYWRINPRSDYNTEIDVKWNSALVTQRLPSKNSSFENNLSPIGCTIIDK